ncbi:MAG TPA: hypothetical protein VEQ85_10060 [Lacipirellulaceae bacterium]|nr:hypothetical protein [Lacipirellulaceae bacterium]
MSQADILAAIRESTPFVPIELTLSTGEKVAIPHPDAALVGKTTTAVLIDGINHLIANVHITRIAPAPAPSAV